MPVDFNVLHQVLSDQFPNSTIELDDTVGDSNHYSVKIISEKFNHLSRVQQHRLVYKALKNHLKSNLHAISIKTFKT